MLRQNRPSFMVYEFIYLILLWLPVLLHIRVEIYYQRAAGAEPSFFIYNDNLMWRILGPTEQREIWIAETRATSMPLTILQNSAVCFLSTDHENSITFNKY